MSGQSMHFVLRKMLSEKENEVEEKFNSGTSRHSKLTTESVGQPEKSVKSSATSLQSSSSRTSRKSPTPWKKYKARSSIKLLPSSPSLRSHCCPYPPKREDSNDTDETNHYQPNVIADNTERKKAEPSSSSQEDFSSGTDIHSLILKDIHPEEWRDRIRSSFRITSLILSTSRSLSAQRDNTSSQNFRFSNVLDQFEHVSSLQTLILTGVSQSLNFDNLSLSLENSLRMLKTLELSDLNMVFKETASLYTFGSALRTRMEVQNRFELCIQRCSIKIPEDWINVPALTLMSVTSNHELNKARKILSCIPKLTSNGSMGNILEQLTMTFTVGSISTLCIHQECNVASCDDVILLYTQWNFKSLPKNPGLENWRISCLKDNCSQCSPLLSLLSVAAHQGSIANLKRQDEKIEVDYDITSFFPEHFAFLEKTIRYNFANQVFQINAGVNEIIFDNEAFNEDEAFIEDPLTFATFLMPKLHFLGFDFVVRTFFIQINNSGWCLTKICLTRDPVSVKFSNGIQLHWPKNSTVQSRILALEIIEIPENVIEQICRKQDVPLVDITPVVYIDQDFHFPFEKRVSVNIPLPVRGRYQYRRVLSKHDGNKFWNEVPINSVQNFPGGFLYESTIFSPVVGVTSESEGIIHFGEVMEAYLQQYVFVTVSCPEPFVMAFDCLKFIDDESRERFKVSEYSKMRPVDRMKNGDRIFASIKKNLKIDEGYEYDLEEDGRLLFQYPDPAHISNFQEYRMVQSDEQRDPEGSVVYYLSTDSRESEQRLFHMRVKLLTRSYITQQANMLDQRTVKDILNVSGSKWPELLLKLNANPASVAHLEDHHLGNVFIEIKEKLTVEERRDLLRHMFQCVEKPALEIEAILGRLSATAQDSKEEFYQLTLEWMKIAPRHRRNITNISECFKKANLTGLLEDLEYITRGVQQKAAQEIIRKFDQYKNKSDFFKEISRFLITQNNSECTKVAFQLLTRLIPD